MEEDRIQNEGKWAQNKEVQIGYLDQGLLIPKSMDELPN